MGLCVTAGARDTALAVPPGDGLCHPVTGSARAGHPPSGATEGQDPAGAAGHLRERSPSLGHGRMVGAGRPPTRSSHRGTFVSSRCHLCPEEPRPPSPPQALPPQPGTRGPRLPPGRGLPATCELPRRPPAPLFAGAGG